MTEDYTVRYALDNMLGNQKVLMGIGAFVLIIILAAGGFFFLSKTKTQQNQAETQTQQVAVIQTLTSEDLGLTFSASDDKKQVRFSISKLDDIKLIDYEIKYEANATDAELAEGADTRLQRGITGEAKIDHSKTSYDSPMLDLGSCSRNVCHYDKGVTSVKLTLKLTKGNGKVYQAESTLTL